MTSCIKQYKYLTTKDNEYIHILIRNKVSKLINNIKASKSDLKYIKDEYTPVEKPLISLLPPLIPILVEQKPEQIEDTQNSCVSTQILFIPPTPIPVEQMQITHPHIKIINNYNSGIYTGGVQIIKNQRYRVNLRR